MTEATHLPAVVLGGADSPLMPTGVMTSTGGSQSPGNTTALVLRTSRNARRRNAAPKRPRPRHRNAGPAPAPRASTKRDRDQPTRLSGEEFFKKVVASSIGGASSSLLGAGGVRIGIPPLLTTGLLAVGGLAVTKLATGPATIDAGTGWISSVVSQLMLQLMGAAPSKPATVVIAQAPAGPQPKLKNADMGTLPPGALDAAFERARSEMAVRGDSYPEDFHRPEHHTIPFVPT